MGEVTSSLAGGLTYFNEGVESRHGKSIIGAVAYRLKGEGICQCNSKRMVLDLYRTRDLALDQTK